MKPTRSFLYIGKNTPGTTSAMRNKYLCKILGRQGWNCSVIDTNEILLILPVFFQSLAYRFNWGPAIQLINKYITTSIQKDHFYDIIWIDKGVFIRKNTLIFLKDYCKKIVHYTPDTAFLYHTSHLFNEGIGYYDFLITTKSLELNRYYKYVKPEKVILTTQGFDKEIHRSYHNFSEKSGVILIGLCEPSREQLVSLLLNNGIAVKVAGKGWERFVKQQKGRDHFSFLGEGLYGIDYGRAISGSVFGLGPVSKKFPELHTTRTFEIPACRTVLVTEDNPEIRTFYTEGEAVFYRTLDELVIQIKDLMNDQERLKSIAQKGYDRVNKNSFDYESILEMLIGRIQ